MKKNKISFFVGIPDSILKNLSNYFGRLKKNKHIIAANEGSAISICIGYYLSTKKIPCVYLQNSGLGNIINPLISLVDEKVYNIPIKKYQIKSEEAAYLRDKIKEISGEENFLI